MTKRRKPGTGDDSAEQQMRDAEVLRANAELASYFEGQRTEREARAALKTLKAFVKDRGRRGAKSRRPLPGLTAAATPPEPAQRQARPAPRTKRKPPARIPADVPRDLPSLDDQPPALTKG